VLTLLVLDF